MHQVPTSPTTFECPLSNDEARKHARLLHALADPYRLRIISLLHRYEGTITVQAIVDTLTYVTQPTCSHHLRVLRDAGLIDYRKDGLNIYYYLLDEKLDEACSAIYYERIEKSA